MGHIAAVTELNAGFRSLGMDGIGEFSEFRDEFIAEAELGVEGDTAPADCSIGPAR